MTEPRDLSEVVVCPVCMLADGAVSGTCRVGHDEVGMVPMMPVSAHEAFVRRANASDSFKLMSTLEGRLSDLREVAWAAINAWDVAYETIRRFPTLAGEVDRLRAELDRAGQESHD